MTYNEALKYLESRKLLGIKPGLERVKALLSLFSNPQQGLPCIHVAGSNGKGSVSAFISGILKEQGYRVGQFSSPYLSSPTEMFRIGVTPISDQDFADLVEEAASYCAVLDKMLGQGPTEYEIYACLALAFFKRSHCDYAVIEACMGGRFDCTNILDDVRACVITKISLEHQSFLGSTLGEIAWHKAGIIKKGVPVVTLPQKPEALEAIRSEAQSAQAPMTIACLESLKVHETTIEGVTFDYVGFKGLKTPIPALYQTENAALALSAVKELSESGLKITEAAIRKGLSLVKWPGRFEVLNREPDFILDCCHNPDGVEAFVRAFHALYGNKKATIIFGVMADKDYPRMLQSLSPMASAIVAIQADSPRALSADILKDAASKTCELVIKSDTIKEAVTKSLCLAGQNGVVCALGSHFHADDIKRALLLQDFGGLLC